MKYYKNIPVVASVVLCVTPSMVTLLIAETAIAGAVKNQQGAGVVTWVGVKPDNFKVTSGEITYYESSPGYQRGFCGLCSSSLTMTGEQYTDVGVTAATLDDCSVAKPESNIFLDSKPPWVIHNEALRNYNQGP